jgi:hypothetical protein
MASDSTESGTTRAHRYELNLWYDEGAAADPAQWRFTLSDLQSNEQVGGVGVAGLAEAVSLLTSCLRSPTSSQEAELRRD